MSSIPTLTRVVANQASKAKTAEAMGSPATAKRPPALAGRSLLELPPQLLSEHQSWVGSGLWQGHFDCALWLRTPQGIPQPMQLALRYVDSQGEKIMPIDRCAAGAYRTVLLNGSLLLKVAGRVKELSFHLLDVSTSMEIIVEEWHLVPQQRRGRH